MEWLGGLLHAVSAGGRYMYRSAQVANDSLHPFKNRAGHSADALRWEDIWERNHTDLQIQKKFKRCKKPQTQEMSRGGKKKQTLNFRHNVFKLKPGCNLNSLPDGKRTVTQCKRNQVFVLGEACPKPRMHKQVQNSKQNVPGHWCTWLLEPEQSNSLHCWAYCWLRVARQHVGLQMSERRQRANCWSQREVLWATSPRDG